MLYYYNELVTPRQLARRLIAEHGTELNNPWVGDDLWDVLDKSVYFQCGCLDSEINVIAAAYDKECLTN